MKIKIGNMWSEGYNYYDILLITGNSYINRNGELVMGRGAALQMKNRFPTFPKEFGDQIVNKGLHLKEYGLVFTNVAYQKILPKIFGVFQVKTHYKNKASLSLIQKSTEKLSVIANFVNCLEWKICINFPGIGYGRLSEKDVIPIISQLPDNVDIYKLRK